jgi:2-succinyl-5-enolpyruvyl-6-hydroxy-3-cyclohexene-1-carboxylate synthase
MTVAATFCATLVDEWIRLGVRHAVVAPGSRSTPLALALTARDEVAIHVVHDERVAAFVALGLGLDDVPAVLLCTSGTAAANFHPAVVEAGLSDVPMLVVTADRPPELRDVGAPQTIDQTHLFGRSVRWFHDPGVTDADTAPTWRSLAARAFAAAVDGPVHLNLPFRDPLVGEPGDLPPRARRAAPGRTRREPAPLPAGLDSPRGVIVAGGRSGVRADDVVALAETTGWPLLADPTSGIRDREGTITAFDALLRHTGFATDHRPDVVVRVGRPPASKVLTQWIIRSGAAVVQVGGPGVIDPDHDVVATCDVGALAGLTGARGTPWAARWRHGDTRAQAAIEAVLAERADLTEPGVARAIAVALPADVELVVASSMPVRDLEWFGGPRARAHANRGANGIDGVVSTALGRALGGRPVAVLAGDIAFAHDSNALIALPRRGVDLRIVVVDNDGGGIFSFLPQATSLSPERFELLFGTPHGTDVVALAAAHGIPASTVTTPRDLTDRVGEPGPWLVRVQTDRAENVRVHDELNAAVVAALDR